MSIHHPELGDHVVMVAPSPLFAAGDTGRIIQVNERGVAGPGYLIRFPRINAALKDRAWVGAHEFKVTQ